jgi:hypothetical protein
MSPTPPPNRRLIVASFALAAVATAWMARRPATAAEVFTDIVPGVGAGGYDLVAYFAQGTPTAGSNQITHSWRGAIWRFASTANRDLFAANPERYAPAYGGHCSWAAAQGYKAKGDPRNWKIVNGRLFLNYNDDVQKRWEASIPEFVTKADTNWPDLRQR